MVTISKKSQIKASIENLTESVNDIDLMLDCPDLEAIKWMLHEIKERRLMSINSLNKMAIKLA
jgi:hypothetical protein